VTEKELSKGESLIWELFLMLRDVANRVGEPGPTAEMTKRQSEWAAKFHVMHDPLLDTETSAKKKSK